MGKGEVSQGQQQQLHPSVPWEFHGQAHKHAELFAWSWMLWLQFVHQNTYRHWPFPRVASAKRQGLGDFCLPSLFHDIAIAQLGAVSHLCKLIFGIQGLLSLQTCCILFFRPVLRGPCPSTHPSVSVHRGEKDTEKKKI